VTVWVHGKNREYLGASDQELIVRRIASLSPLRAVLIALAWPTLIYAIPSLIIGWSHVSNWVGEHTGGGSYSEVFVVSEPATGVQQVWGMVIFFGPSLVFLTVWWLLRRRVTK
jgi:hypothetical protein